MKNKFSAIDIEPVSHQTMADIIERTRLHTHTVCCGPLNLPYGQTTHWWIRLLAT